MTGVSCEWCGSSNTYAAGFSQFCIETQFRCRDCGGNTWADAVQDVPPNY